MVDKSAAAPTLEQFRRRQASTDGVVNFTINGAIHYLFLTPLAIVPVTNDWFDFDPSLFGFLCPLTILLSFIQSYVSVWTTVSRRRKGKVLPALPSDVKWRRFGLKLAGQNGIVAAMVIIPAAALADLIVPNTAIDPMEALAVIAVLAGILGAAMSARAISKTAVLPAAAMTESAPARP